MIAGPPEIQAVLFDYGQVLSLPPDPAAWQRMLDITGIAPEPFHQGYWAFRHPYDRNDLSGVAYWHKVAESAAAKFSSEQLSQLIAADIDLWSRINTPMLDWAQRLQASTMRTGILSNIGDEMTHGLLARFPWLQRFDYLLWSYQHALAKPEPAIYHAAAEGLRTPPEHILFLDDKPENIGAARSVGMNAIQYDLANHSALLTELERLNLAHLLTVSAPSVS